MNSSDSCETTLSDLSPSYEMHLICGLPLSWMDDMVYQRFQAGQELLGSVCELERKKMSCFLGKSKV